MVYMVAMRSRSRPLLICAVAIAWLILGPLAVVYGSCAIMCDACDMMCPAAPGVADAPCVDWVLARADTSASMCESLPTIALTPPAPPPKSLPSA